MSNIFAMDEDNLNHLCTVSDTVVDVDELDQKWIYLCDQQTTLTLPVVGGIHLVD